MKELTTSKTLKRHCMRLALTQSLLWKMFQKSGYWMDGFWQFRELSQGAGDRRSGSHLRTRHMTQM